MATVQKTTLKRYNGTDWDPIYLANSSDITFIGTGFTVTQDTAGYSINDAISSTDTVQTVLKKVINNLTTVNKVSIPELVNGTAITALAASKLTGIIARTSLPSDVSGKGVEVATETAKSTLTYADVNKGDIVKVTNGKVYLVSGATQADGVSYMELNDSASSIEWSRVTGTPTTLAGYGITDAVNVSDVVTTATANKVLKLNADSKLPASITGDAATIDGHATSYFATKGEYDTLASTVNSHGTNIGTLNTEIKAIDGSWITTGTISIDRLPATAIERMHVVADTTALSTMTSSTAQNGDTVKVTSTGAMYFVTDDTKLNTVDYIQGLTEYTAGTAASVDWSGVRDRPTTLAGYGITDAVNVSDVVTTATANKVLKLNADSKLPASITGDAQSLQGHVATYFATQSDMTNVKTTIGDGESGLVKDVTTLKTTVGDSNSGIVKDVTTLKSQMGTTSTAGTVLNDIVNLKAGTAITALAASKLTGIIARTSLPSDVSGRLFNKASMSEAYTSLTAANCAVGDLVKTTDGKVYIITDTANLDSATGYTVIVDITASSVHWSQILDIPTTLAAMNWSDAVTTAMLTTTASSANAGKILTLNSAGKLDVSITGDAATFAGHTPTYFTTATEHTTLAGRVTTNENDIATLKTNVKNIDGSWITTGTISIDRLPHGALERCYVVADDTARLALTTASVQTGDTVKVTATNKMYFVVDDTKLATEEGYEVYTAGTATAVDWAGVQNHPTTLAGYGITDAVNSSEKVTTASAANAGKILVLNANGKLDVDITGFVDWANINNKPVSTVTAIDAAVAAATHTNRTVLDKLTYTDNHLNYDGNALVFKSELDAIALGSLVIGQSSDMSSATVGQMVLEPVS